MAIKIKLFGQLKQLAGSSELAIDNIPDTNQLIKKMQSLFPVLEKMPYLIAVNETIIQENTILQPGQEIALLPPYSGG